MIFRKSSLLVATGIVLLLPLAAVAATVNVTVNTATVIRNLSDELFSQNMSVYDSTALASNTTYTQAVSAMGVPLMRFPGGGYADLVDWSDIECGGGSLAWMINITEGVSFIKACNMRMQPIVSYSGYWCSVQHGHDAAVQKAADWVRYMNVTPGAQPVTYWEIGNETFGSGEQGYVSDDYPGGQIYGNHFVDFYNAMKAVDPNIRVGAQCQFDHPPWSQGALAAIRAQGVTPDFLIAHAYPKWCPDVPTCDQVSVDSEVLGPRVDDATTFTSLMNGLVSGAGYPVTLPYWMTEYRSSLPEQKVIQFVDALWTAQFLLELGRQGWQGANPWSIRNGYSPASQGDYGLLRNGSANPDDNPASTPRPTWYVFPLLARVFGRTMVSCTEDGTLVRAWAARDPSDNLTVLMVNNDPNNAATADLSISGITAGASGRVWTLEGAGTTRSDTAVPVLQRRWISVNGVVNPPATTMPGTGDPLATGNAFSVNLPAASLVLVQVPGQWPPTPTATSTPTPTPTPTGTHPTVTPTRTPTNTRTWTPSPTPISTTCVNLFNGCEWLAENGTWTSSVSSGVTTVLYSVADASGSPPGFISQGGNCVRAQAATTFTWNNRTMRLANFSPALWGPVVQLIMDIYVDVAPAGSSTLTLLADGMTQPIASPDFAVVQPGLNRNLIFNIDYMARGLTPGAPITQIRWRYNSDAVNPVGSLYVDNLRLVMGCRFTPTPTPLPPRLEAVSQPVVWPNPWPDPDAFAVPNSEPGTVLVHDTLGKPAQWIAIRLFTTSSRKVGEQRFSEAPAGIYDLPFILKDEFGDMLSNGVYHLEVTTNAGRALTKMLLLK